MSHIQQVPFGPLGMPNGMPLLILKKNGPGDIVFFCRSPNNIM